MKQIRHSVFETNSSSSHSITLLKNNDFSDEWKEEHEWEIDNLVTGSKISDYEVWEGDSYYIEYDCVYHVYGGKFGWQWFVLKDFNAKMDYVYTLFKEYWEYDNYGYYADLIDKVREKYPDYKQTLTDIIKRYYKGEVVDVVFEKADDCYIDHSADYADMILFNDKWNLEEILFNPDIVILGGNDNEC